jgi:hypothetical protein
MRRGVSSLAALAVIGCSDVRPSPATDETLVKIAESEVARLGFERQRGGQPPQVVDEGSKWVVVLDPPPPNWKGGGIEVSIDKQTRRVLDVVGAK